MRRAIILATFAVSACAANPSVPPAFQPAEAIDPVDQAAAILAKGANPAVTAAEQAKLIAALDRLGLNAASDSDEDPVAEWRRDAIKRGFAPTPERGRALGPAYRSGWLEPGASKSLDQLFLAGKTAKIILSSPDRQPISLAISDAERKVVCRQDGIPPGRCQWVAIFTQRYRIELANRGTARLRYFLVTN